MEVASDRLLDVLFEWDDDLSTPGAPGAGAASPLTRAHD